MRTRILYRVFLAVAILLWNVAAGENIAPGVSVVVIDAGHGGKLPGAVYGKAAEKQIVLDVALKLGRMIESGMPGVKVVYTRSTDKMLGADLATDLQRRADIANRAGGELFISIHANAAKSTSAKGVEVLVMGETPKEQKYNTDALYAANREDLIDLATEPDAPIIRARIQNMQVTYGDHSMAMARCLDRSFRNAGREMRRIKPQLLRVLYATDMPGVLVEIGFMSNAAELALMTSDKGRTQIARNMFDALKEYSAYMQKIRQGDAATTAATPVPATTPAPADKRAEADTPAPVPAPKVTAAVGELRYTIQVSASKTRLETKHARWKSWSGKVKCYTADGGLYKYCVGDYATRDAAKADLARVRRTFADAFIVCRRGEKIVKK